MNQSVIAIVATGLVAAVAGFAIAGLPSDPPGSGLRITAVAATTTTQPPVTAASTTTTTPSTTTTTVRPPVTAAQVTVSTDEPVETTPPSDGTVSDTTAPSPTDPGADPTDSSGDAEPIPRGDLIVIAANAGSRAGIATETADNLRGIGYVRAVPLDADENSDTSDVYYRAGLEDEALRLAAELGWSEGDIAPLEQAPAFTTQLDVDLAVVLGQDSR